MLCACPLLETLLIAQSSFHGDPSEDHTLVSLPHLRSIEMGVYEARSGLITLLQLPSNITVGFRALHFPDVCRDIPPEVVASLHHVLRRADIRTITLAAPPYPRGDVELLALFEGPQDSLKMYTCGHGVNTRTQLRDYYFPIHLIS